MSRTDELRALGARWNEAWNSRDVEQLVAFFAPDATYYEPDLEGPVDGARGIVEIAQRTWRDWPKASFEAVSLTIEDPRVVVEWRSSATHQSGVSLQLEGIDVLEWKGDKLTAARVYYDIHQRQLALGSK